MKVLTPEEENFYNSEQPNKGKRKKIIIKKLEITDNLINRYLHSYAEEKIQHSNKFVILKTDYLHNLYNLPPNCIKIMLFFHSRVNRKSGESYEVAPDGTFKFTSQYVWGNLDKYYREGFLAVAVTQTWVGKQLDMFQPQVSVAFKQLIENNYLKILGYEWDRSKKYQLTIYALGMHQTVMGEKVEFFYYEAGDITK